MGVLDFWVVFVFLGLSLQSQVLNSQKMSCNSNDLKALEGFLSELGSGINGWDTNSSSSSPNCCNWLGITCDSPAAGGRVVKLELSGKRLTGKISQSLSGLDQLKTLNLSFNFLRSPLPQSLLNFPNLEVLDLSNNNLFSSIPGDINLPSLQILDISDNSLTGSVPMGIWNNLTRIRFVDMGFNYFSGSIPPGIGNCSSLEHLCLASNDLIGPIPENLFRLPKLGHLSLPENRLSGELSDGIGNLSNLVHLDISANCPIGLNCLAMSSLVSLDLATNQFTGPVPDNLPSCPQLKNINLAKNYFTGQIPESFRNFQSLTSLSLSNSSISNLSDALGILQNCQNLTTLVLTLNFHSETLPSDPSLGFKNLKALVIANCGLTGVIPQWLHGLIQLQLLDLSLNRLGGTIPPWLGNFDSLFLPGFVPQLFYGGDSEEPDWITEPHLQKCMTSMENLDLSHNNLSGTIPPSLVSLSFLSRFNVAYNQLHGVIPVGGQFPTFPNSSFEGNPGLCGEHASPCPSSDKQTPQVSPRKSKRRRKGVIIGMAVGIGFGTTFLLALMFLIILRASSRQEVDPEKEDQDDANGKKFEELGSRLVVLFRNKDNNKELTLDDLLKSTNDFDQENIIGCGGFGLVYRATLPDGRKVAIKRLCVARYCNYRNDRLLIYSYMENGSLDYWLHEKLDGPSSLDWDRRLQIAQGAVRGLAYLHQSCEPHILHRDIKSSNILLDENFEAHLADFGLARLILSPYDTHVTTDLVGTLGYIPPEYGQASVATYKGDVYSFGVVLLELLTGKRPMDMCKAKENRDLISWVLRMRREKLETQVFDPFIYDKQKSKEMLRVLEIACRCLCDCPKLRPSTLQLVSWLDNVDCDV
ncbi:phytosulfokin receptor 1 [Actinidia rufa]|uniref:non-specific serine/threonine protein kinase n=1 Tax=Actinidia rufa TaxID=165716 RepID=A0A7J0EX67_9ERIC|nr:phytosulfokin receptor 1 [Actinidia rufa]